MSNDSYATAVGLANFPSKRWQNYVCCSDHLRRPDNLSNLLRFTALRPYLAIGLPLSCAIVSLPKNKPCGNRQENNKRQAKQCQANTLFCLTILLFSHQKPDPNHCNGPGLGPF